MKIIEIEYGATISHNYNNYRVMLRAQIDNEKENVHETIEKLRKMVKDELLKDIIESDPKIKDKMRQINALLNTIKDKISKVVNSKEYKNVDKVIRLTNDIEILRNRIKKIEKELAEVYNEMIKND